MVKVCVASVFANDDKTNQDWLDLQLRFLRRTTPQFDHYAVIMENTSEEGEAVFRSKTEVIIPDRSPYPDNPWPPIGCHMHLRGLHTIHALFKEKLADYSGFLLLDSDAFPVMHNWADHLTRIMRDSVYGKDVAITLRTEHLENRLHGCAMYCLPQAIHNLNFHHKEEPGGCLLGMRELDTQIGDYQDKMRDRVFPLLNSNQHKVHPLFCMVYYNMFYHQGCGSRRASYRGTTNYWNHVLGGYVQRTDLWAQQQQFTRQLFEDPEGFVQYLRGWDH
ncbi:MAG: hypothetical protein ACXABD_10400 [Candidatus Thorarchaeota archaeon]|jgi:hypothetical protein